MKGFQFRLERLRRVRRTQERLARGLLAAAQARAQEAAHQAQLAALACERGVEELRAAQAQSRLSPSEILRAQDALRRLASQASRERALATRRRAEVEATREAWLARRAEVEGLERWRERERLSHTREAERRAAGELDETAGRRAAQARRGPRGGPARPQNGRSQPHGPEFPVHLHP